MGPTRVYRVQEDPRTEFGLLRVADPKNGSKYNPLDSNACAGKTNALISLHLFFCA